MYSTPQLTCKAPRSCTRRSTGRIDLKLAEGQPYGTNSLDMDKTGLQEIIDTLSVMVFQLRDEVLQLRDENARMNSTLTEALLDKQPVKSSDARIKQLASIIASGKVQRANQFTCAQLYCWRTSRTHAVCTCLSSEFSSAT
jgi:hypothetical protein